MNNKIVCFYHGNCADGFTAAWILHNFFKNQGVEVLLIPSFYQNRIDGQYHLVEGAIVYIVDFSFPIDITKDLCDRAEKVIMIDHHKTAQEMIVGKFSAPNFECHFDMTRSGAGLTWDFFYPGCERPNFVNYVEDRDLWKKQMPFTNEAAEMYFSKEYSFENWDRLLDMFNQEPHEWLSIATGINEYKVKSYKEMCEAAAFFVIIDGHKIAMCNLPYMWGSDACHYLCEQHGKTIDCAAYYWDSEGYRNFGLRSIGDFDVSRIAKSFGGGGHKNAAGFKLKISEGEIKVAEWKRATKEIGGEL